MKDVPDLTQRNESFVHQIAAIDPAYFERMSKGQQPNCFVLACSDSRVSPSVVMQSPLGYLFVHRNIANQVVHDDPSLEAGLYYALQHLKVKKIIIKGHTGCGGIAAAKTANQEPHLLPWLGYIRAGLEEHLTGEKDLSVDDLARLNVLAQMEHLANHSVYKAYGGGVLIEGYLFHLESGRLELVARREASDRLDYESLPLLG